MSQSNCNLTSNQGSACWAHSPSPSRRVGLDVNQGTPWEKLPGFRPPPRRRPRALVIREHDLIDADRLSQPPAILLLSRHRRAGDLCAQQRADGISRRPVVPLLIAASHLDLGYFVLDHIVAMFREASVACTIGHLNTRAMVQPCCAMTSFWGSSVSFPGRAPDLGFSVQYLHAC
jgi:hypothetical protein